MEGEACGVATTPVGNIADSSCSGGLARRGFDSSLPDFRHSTGRLVGIPSVVARTGSARTEGMWERHSVAVEEDKRMRLRWRWTGRWQNDERG